MLDIALDTAAGVRTLDARARRRRMHRRFAKRRMVRVFAASLAILIVALVLTPERSVGPASVVATSALPTGALALQPVWRPAGSVLTRRPDAPGFSGFARKADGTAVTASLPFGLMPKPLATRDTVAHESLARWHRIYTYTAQYRIKADLARRIYDASVTAGIEPELGFRLVRVESVFNPRAQSPVGALGLTQLMLGTAREYEPKVTREQLLDPDINLRIGFKYLRGLIRDYKGDLRIALLVYNRGPNAVHNAIAMGVDPANGYESIVMRGYRGRGTLE